jgi:hypothetical protein
MFDHAWRHDLAGRVDDTADRTLRPDFGPLSGTGIDTFEMAAIENAALLVEIPPGNPVHRRHDGGFRTEQRSECTGAGVRLLGLQRADHDILRTKFCRVVACRQMHSACLPLND